jgi:uncharacterized membrane protein (UPF0127 family)
MRRPRGRLLLLLAGALLVAGVGAAAIASARSPARPAASQGGPARPAPGTAEYLLHGQGHQVAVAHLEVAATPAARERGLMGRTRVAPGTGMAFLFPADTATGFWMKGTLVPLSIAFVAADGRVVAVREMTPCLGDPCPVYGPGRSYRYAVELAAGAFAAAGVGEGSQVVPRDTDSLPTAS